MAKFILYFSISVLFLASCNEKLEEQIVSRHSNGAPMKIEYFNWVGSEKNIQKEIRYYANGEKEIEGELKDGEREGKWTYWYLNGQKWSEGYFKDGKSHGKFTIWYESGLKNYEAEYVNGKPDGIWIFYDLEGEKFKKVIFDNGEKVEEQEYQSATGI